MLTISQLAAHAGVTVRAVRHYHQVGLLPEPERDASGYRRYDARAVVRLIRIRTLAEAGVPLARVQALLEADEDQFREAVAEIDRRLRGEIQDLQEHRRRIGKLAAGDSLALPSEVTDYLDGLRAIGVPELLVEMERDAWILIAARWPEKIPEFMAEKVAQLDDPLLSRLYRIVGTLLSGEDDSETSLVEAADLLAEMAEQASARGELDQQDELLTDRSFVDLVDTVVLAAGPRVVGLQERLQELMVERGWTGWTRIERVDDAPRRVGQPALKGRA
jgi:DNA-binding transcriptional MerR regulator